MGLESKDENKTIVRRWIELWNTKGADGVDDVFAPDFRDPQLEQRLGQRITLEIFKDSLRALQGSMGHAQFDEQEMLSEGDRVMVRWTMRGTHQGPLWGLPPSGRSFALDGVNIFRIEGERIVERLSYLDVASLFAQLGPQSGATASSG